MAAKFVNEIEIAKAQRDFELKNATFDQEVQTKKAQSELAYALQVKNIVHSLVYIWPHLDRPCVIDAQCTVHSIWTLVMIDTCTLHVVDSVPYQVINQLH